jgi:hypothetical protein
MATATRTQAKCLGVHTLAGICPIEVFCCGQCGVVFGFTESLVDIRRDDHKTWYCPNGHHWSFTGENTEERLKRELKQEKDRAARTNARLDQVRAERDHAKASLTSTKGVVTKLKKRVANGVCPCCNRTFKDLARHMAGQHPDFAGKVS